MLKQKLFICWESHDDFVDVIVFCDVCVWVRQSAGDTSVVWEGGGDVTVRQETPY